MSDSVRLWHKQKLGVFLPLPISSQRIFVFLHISQHICVGKDVKGWWEVWDAERVAPRQEEEDVLPLLGCLARPCHAGGCRGTQVGAGTRRTMRIWWPEDGSCQGDVPPSPHNFPHHFKYTLKHNHCIHCIALRLCCAPHMHRAKQCCPLRESTKSRLDTLKYFSKLL